MNGSWLAERLLWINLAWYIALTAAFAVAGIWGKTLYFLGATILTVGVILM